MSAPDFSIVIICQDEARTITSCVQAALRVTPDVVVVDSGSSDGSDTLAELARARVFPYSWQGYGANKNYGVEHAKAEWIISIDADEVMNEDLILHLSTFTPQRGTVYQLNSLVHLDGQWVRYSGWHPVWKNRIYHRRDQSWNAANVHEDLTPLDGVRIERLPGLLLHYSYKDIQDHKERMGYYAKLKAQEWHRQGKKIGLWKRWIGPPFRWVRSYLIKQGWRDGHIGSYIASSDVKMIRLAIKEYDRIATSKQ